MSSLENAKDFVAEHEKDIDEATGKAGGLAEDRELPAERADDTPAETETPEARDL
ncbi:hypothetical protein [Cryptosporangium sp. NPDC048952]|uniref:hypothetical protein n=1 Tax=Cryptosporangium sp. NPDC048952 TaxID=3363961 RepID=UPI0037144E7B